MTGTLSCACLKKAYELCKLNFSLIPQSSVKKKTTILGAACLFVAGTDYAERKLTVV